MLPQKEIYRCPIKKPPALVGASETHCKGTKLGFATADQRQATRDRQQHRGPRLRHYLRYRDFTLNPGVYKVEVGECPDGVECVTKCRIPKKQPAVKEPIWGGRKTGNRPAGDRDSCPPCVIDPLDGIPYCNLDIRRGQAAIVTLAPGRTCSWIKGHLK